MIDKRRSLSDAEVDKLSELDTPALRGIYKLSRVLTLPSYIGIAVYAVYSHHLGALYHILWAILDTLMIMVIGGALGSILKSRFITLFTMFLAGYVPLFTFLYVLHKYAKLF